MAIKPLPKDKKLSEIHDWWNYGINPVTGMRVEYKSYYGKNEAAKYERRIDFVKRDKKN